MTPRAYLVLMGLTACAGQIDPAGDPGEEGLVVAAPDDAATTSGGLSGPLNAGDRLETTANLNLRTGPSVGDSVRLVMPKGSSVTVVQAASSGGFYDVKYNGTVGWASGQYLKASAAQPPPGAGGLGEASRAGAVERAKSAVGASYWWGHARWYPYDSGGSNEAASCTGSCPSCTHAGASGADCSGYVAKLWQVPTTNDTLTVEDHPYTTSTFVTDSSQWHTVSRDSLVQADALVYHSGGEGHIFLYDDGDGWGWMHAYEAKGCSYGVVHDLRSASSAYHAIRHY